MEGGQRKGMNNKELDGTLENGEIIAGTRCETSVSEQNGPTLHIIEAKIPGDKRM